MSVMGTMKWKHKIAAFAMFIILLGGFVIATQGYFGSQAFAKTDDVVMVPQSFSKLAETASPAGSSGH